MRKATYLVFTILFLIACVSVGLDAAYADNLLPDKTLTPGVARTDITLDNVCTTKWGKDTRLVTEEMKKEIFTNYTYSGNDDARCLVDKNGRHCELDHLISRELGGADDVKNMWPQSYGGDWGASMKDRLENKLHKLVCETKSLSLKDAQDAISDNWIDAYKKYIGDE
jgi:hypothetical protein